MSNPATIHIALLGEGTEVWHPVQAEHVALDFYLVLGPAPDDEEWAFPPGSVVRCVARDLSGDGGHPEPCQVAVARVERESGAS